MEVKVYAQDGADTGRTVTLDAAVFEAEPNDHCIWLDVRRIQAAKRQGTHKAKERNETAGSTRKLYRQKGTGGARAGSAKSPIRRSGGTIFGPRPRDYSFKVNRKTQRVARRSALAYKAQAEAIRVVEGFGFEAPSTQALRQLLSTVGVLDQKVLILTAEHSPAVYRSGANLRKVRVQEARNATTFDLLDAGVILVQEGALEVLSGILGDQPAATAAA